MLRLVPKQHVWSSCWNHGYAFQPHSSSCEASGCNLPRESVHQWEGPCFEFAFLPTIYNSTSNRKVLNMSFPLGSYVGFQGRMGFLGPLDFRNMTWTFHFSLGLESLISHPPFYLCQLTGSSCHCPCNLWHWCHRFMLLLGWDFWGAHDWKAKNTCQVFFSQTTIVGIRFLVPSRKVHIWYVLLHIPFNAVSLDLVVPSTDAIKNLKQFKCCSQFMQVAGVGVNCNEQRVFGKHAGIWKQIWTLK